MCEKPGDRLATDTSAPVDVRLRWDLFCKVVDNYGDIGVSWRLSRALAQEHGQHVRLWVDRLEPFAQLLPVIDVQVQRQNVDHVEVLHWTPHCDFGDIADVVVEAFGCPLPDDYLAAMVQRNERPAWINLEYLTAESWAEDFHGNASPHPQLPLVKYFYFPGFTDAVGGVLHEYGLDAAREEFQRSAVEKERFWQQLGLDCPTARELRVSLFGYPNAPLVPMLRAWMADGENDWTILVPENFYVDVLRSVLGQSVPEAGRNVRCGSLKVHVFPFLSQDRFDRLLWACDLNFVRGEDSLVRAIWARRPFVWNIYPQPENAHMAKLDAFLDNYLSGWEPGLEKSWREMWHAWNGDGDAVGSAWVHWWPDCASSRARINEWSERVASRVDLATKLVQFAANLLRC